MICTPHFAHGRRDFDTVTACLFYAVATPYQNSRQQTPSSGWRQIPAHVQSKTLATSVRIDVTGGSLPNRENETEGPRLLGKTCP
jgi:hypothetical protein